MSLSSPFLQLGLIGYPLSHSLSPQIHTAALQSCGLSGAYSLFLLYPGDERGLKDLLARVRSGEIHGLNVTIPHKQDVVRFLDELTPTAESIGAVNTIYLRDKKLIGENTDAPGFLSNLQGFLTTRTLRHGDSHALVLGAGGAARAVIYALLNNGWNVTIAARRTEQIQQLVDSFANYESRITVCSLSSVAVNPNQLDSALSEISLIVNATPSGMAPNVDQSPWHENIPFPPHAAIYDLVYNPPETKLVRDARRQGLQATAGLGMLIEQAALAFEIWTSCSPSRAMMKARAAQSLIRHAQPVEASNYGDASPWDQSSITDMGTS